MDIIFIIIIFALSLIIWPIKAKGIFFLLIPIIIWIWLINKRVKTLEQQLLNLNNQQQNVPEQNQAAVIATKQENIYTKPIIEKIEITEPKVKLEKINFEQKWGARLPVWIGAISLALAGFFLVKYSIENDLLSPEMRMILGGLFGIALLYAAQKIRSNPVINNNIRIAQGLAGAGIIDLYISVYAASNIYNLLPPVPGFIGMAVVTSVAIAFSLMHGYQIAILGLIGGFITPILFKSNNPSAPLLFSYLYFLIAGSLWMIRKNNWWFLYIPIILCEFLWVIIWLFSPFQPHDSYSITLFLIAVSGTNIYSVNRKIKEGDGLFKSKLIPGYLSLGGTLVLTAIVTVKSQFGFGEWALLWLISAASIVLTYFNRQLYGFLPWVALALNMLMLALWPTQDTFTVKLIILAFCLLFCLSSSYLTYFSNDKLSWGKIAVSSWVSYYLLGYYRLAGHLIEDRESWLYSLPLWGMLALGVAYISLLAVEKILHYPHLEEPVKQRLLTIFVLNVTFFLSIAVTIELEGSFLPIAIACQILAISWINNRVDIKSLPKIAECLGLIYIYLIAFDLCKLITTVISLPNKNHWLGIDHPFITVLIPSIMLLGSTILFRKKEDKKTVYYFEIFSSILLGISIIAFVQSLIMYIGHKYDLNLLLVYCSICTNLLLVYCWGCSWVSQKYNREAFKRMAEIFMSLALFRIFVYQLFDQNPLFVGNHVGEIFLLNNLLLVYLAPAVLLFYIQKNFKQLSNFAREIKLDEYLIPILGFTFVSLNIRQYFHGTILYRGETSNAEIYSYSIVWLLLAIGLLCIGISRQDKGMRLASMGMLVVTICKVFLYDAAALTGLFRIFSFLGLGVALIGLSFLYARYISVEEKH